MADRLDRLEGARRRLRLRQVELATALGATQGHYSKVARRRTPPGPALAEKIDRWLASHDAEGGPDETIDVMDKVTLLAESIRNRCAELLVLVGSGQTNDRSATSEATSRRR